MQLFRTGPFVNGGSLKYKMVNLKIFEVVCVCLADYITLAMIAP